MIGTSGVPVGQCSGGRLAKTLVAIINDIIFSFLRNLSTKIDDDFQINRERQDFS